MKSFPSVYKKKKVISSVLSMRILYGCMVWNEKSVIRVTTQNDNIIVTSDVLYWGRHTWANSVDTNQSAPGGTI